MQKKLSYSEVLKEIDKLRAEGVAESDLKIRKLKVQLWGHLEKRNRNKSTKIVPVVTAIKTVKLDLNTLGSNLEKDAAITKSSNKESYAKYVLLGIVVAVAMICYKLFKKD